MSKITDVKAHWLRCPIPEDKQHVSDYGLLTHFDMTLVVVTTEDGSVPGITMHWPEGGDFPFWEKEDLPYPLSVG